MMTLVSRSLIGKSHLMERENPHRATMWRFFVRGTADYKSNQPRNVVCKQPAMSILLPNFREHHRQLWAGYEINHALSQTNVYRITLQTNDMHLIAHGGSGKHNKMNQTERFEIGLNLNQIQWVCEWCEWWFNALQSWFQLIQFYVGFMKPRSTNSQLCYVEGEKERKRMMQNEDKRRLFIIIITISYDS